MALFEYIRGNVKTVLEFWVDFFPIKCRYHKTTFRELAGWRTPKTVWWGFFSESMWGKSSAFSTKFELSQENVTGSLYWVTFKPSTISSKKYGHDIRCLQAFNKGDAGNIIFKQVGCLSFCVNRIAIHSLKGLYTMLKL